MNSSHTMQNPVPAAPAESSVVAEFLLLKSYILDCQETQDANSNTPGSFAFPAGVSGLAMGKASLLKAMHSPTPTPVVHNSRIEIMLMQECHHWISLSAPSQDVSIENKADYCDSGFIVIIAGADKIVEGQWG